MQEIHVEFGTGFRPDGMRQEPVGPSFPRLELRSLRLGILMLFSGIMLTLVATFASATTTHWALPDHYVVKGWSVEDGLPQNTVLDIVQDRTGHVWLATLDGLSRFDGYRFRNYRLGEYPELGSNRIEALIEADDGSIWIGTDSHGLVRYKDGVFLPSAFCTRQCGIQDFERSGSGRVWVLSSKGIFGIDATSMNIESAVEAPGHGAGIHWLHSVGDEHDSLLFSSLKQLHRWDPNRQDLQSWPLPEPGSIRSAHPSGRGVYLVGNQDITWFEDGQVRPSPVDLTGALDRVRRVFSLGPDALLVSDRSGQTRYRDSIGVDREIPELAGMAIQAAHVDAGGALWIGTRFNGVLRISDSRLFRVSAPIGSGERREAVGSVLPIIEDGRGGVLVGRVCGGVLRIDAGGVVDKLVAGGESLQRCIWSMHRDADGSVLIASTNDFVQRLRDGELTNLVDPAGNAIRVSGRFLFRDRDDQVWLGTGHGLYQVNGQVVERVPSSPEELLLVAADDPGHGLILGTGHGLARLREGRHEKWTTGEAIDSMAVRAIHFDADGNGWFGTYGGGLWRLRDGAWTQIGPRNGLAADVVSCILEDDQRRLWMSSNHGIFQASIDQLDAVADGRTDRIDSWTLTEADGMPDRETNGGGQPACHEGQDGRFWFPTVRGPVWFDPLAIREFDPKTRVRIESMRVGGQALAIDEQPVELPVDAANLAVDFVAPQFDHPERLRFRYRLAGIEQQWNEVDDGRSALYPIVPEGEFRFEVQLGVDDGRWLPDIASVGLKRPERWTRQELAQLLLAFAVFLATVAILRWRIHLLRRRDAQMTLLIDQRTRELQEKNAELDRLSRTDELTGIANSRRLRHFLAEQWQTCIENRRELCLIVLDVDRFKDFNDAHGHQAGDRLLRALAQSLNRIARSHGGLMARYGGEEFVVVLPGFSQSEGADVAEQLRQAVISLEFRRPDPMRGFVTASFGVSAMVPTAESDPEKLLRCADHALYRAKSSGRDRVEAGC